MKNMHYTATFAAVFFGLAILNAGAVNPVKTSKSNVSNNRAAAVSDPKDEDCDGRADAPDCKSADVTSPRDHASGLPTGKRMHKPMVITKDLDKSTTAPGDQTAPQTSNRESSAPSISEVVVTKPMDQSSDPSTAPATGTVSSPRDAASGQATGKRQHKPMMPPRDASSGMATGRMAEGTDPNSGSNGNGGQPASFTYPILPAIKSTLVSMPETDPTLEIKR